MPETPFVTAIVDGTELEVKDQYLSRVVWRYEDLIARPVEITFEIDNSGVRATVESEDGRLSFPLKLDTCEVDRLTPRYEFISPVGPYTLTLTVIWNADPSKAPEQESPVNYWFESPLYQLGVGDIITVITRRSEPGTTTAGPIETNAYKGQISKFVDNRGPVRASDSENWIGSEHLLEIHVETDQTWYELRLYATGETQRWKWSPRGQKTDTHDVEQVILHQASGDTNSLTPNPEPPASPDDRLVNGINPHEFRATVLTTVANVEWIETTDITGDHLPLRIPSSDETLPRWERKSSFEVLVRYQSIDGDGEKTVRGVVTSIEPRRKSDGEQLYAMLNFRGEDNGCYYFPLEPSREESELSCITSQLSKRVEGAQNSVLGPITRATINDTGQTYRRKRVRRRMNHGNPDTDRPEDN